jgi:predicted AAA+ superfamily ATPase
MDSRFLPHNLHLETIKTFLNMDPHLKLLSKQPLVYRSPIIDEIPEDIPGIFTLSGGRQIGKTTLLKQWMVKILKSHVQPERIVFFTGELIDDHHSLVRLLSDHLKEMPKSDILYILLDEVTYIKNWDKGVKYLADAGALENAIVMITGSDLNIIKEARMRFPGRRGRSNEVNFHLYPLHLLDVIQLKKSMSNHDIRHLLDLEKMPSEQSMNILFEEFEKYLQHGGFLTAINDMAEYDRILPSTFSTYCDWIRGDILKRHKQEHYLLEILETIIKHYSSQVTWNALLDDLSIDHPKTIADYMALLSSMDVVFIQAALLEDKLTASPKKAKKVMFTDPFIFHAINAWLKASKDPFHDQVKPLLQDAEWGSKLAEACGVTHYSRHFPTYYIKSKGEVDIAYIADKRFRPVEIKWTNQVRPKQLKQIAKYKNGTILTKSKTMGEIQGIPTIPLPLALLRLCAK